MKLVSGAMAKKNKKKTDLLCVARLKIIFFQAPDKMSGMTKILPDN